MSQDDKDAFLAKLRAFEGQVMGEPFEARDPVNQPMIRHWCDAIGDENPIYTEPDEAAGSMYGEIVAPPTMIQAWTMRGLKPPPAAAESGPSIQERIFALFDEAGFTSVVAVDADQEYVRYVKPGDVLTQTVTLERVTEEKKTALGRGHFIQQLYTWTDQDGETVATMRWRLLKFKPRQMDAPKATESEAPKPAAPRPRPSMTRDTAFFFKGLEEKKILIQKCRSCAQLRHPPEPMCHHCRSLEWDAVEASGRGEVYSFVVMHYPPVPAFDYPNPIALIELEEGVRLVSNVVGLPKDEVKIGMKVKAEFVAFDEELTLHQFRPEAG